MTLNCTINAYPLSNKYFWRKDGNYITSDYKHEIKNIRLNEYILVSQLLIKYYDENDQGLYECSAENDLRVSKIVYNLKGFFLTNTMNYLKFFFIQFFIINK